MTVKVNRAVGLLRDPAAIAVGFHRAVIPGPPRRIGQVLNIIAHGQHHLIGDKPLIHQIQHQQVRHLPDDQLCLVRLIGAVQDLTGAETVGAGAVRLDGRNGGGLPAPRMVDEQFRVLAEELIKQVLIPLRAEGNIAHGEHPVLLQLLCDAPAHPPEIGERPV